MRYQEDEEDQRPLSDPNSKIQYVILPSDNGTPTLLNIGKGG